MSTSQERRSGCAADHRSHAGVTQQAKEITWQANEITQHAKEVTQQANEITQQMAKKQHRQATGCAVACGLRYVMATQQTTSNSSAVGTQNCTQHTAWLLQSIFINDPCSPESHHDRTVTSVPAAHSRMADCLHMSACTIGPQFQFWSNASACLLHYAEVGFARFAQRNHHLYHKQAQFWQVLLIEGTVETSSSSSDQQLKATTSNPPSHHSHPLFDQLFGHSSSMYPLFGHSSSMQRPRSIKQASYG
jgi:hypothetical protein